MPRKLLGILCIWVCCLAAYPVSDEKCDPYAIPEDCLGRTVAALDGLDFITDPRPNASYDVISTSPHNNPLGLHVTVYTKNKMICFVRYSISTAQHSISYTDFDQIKNQVISRNSNVPWVERNGGSDYEYAKIYNDGKMRINISGHHINFTGLSGCSEYAGRVNCESKQ